MHARSLFGRSLAMVSLVVLGGATLAQEAAPPKIAIEPDGTVHMPAQSVPVSALLSPEGKAYLTEHLRNLQRPEMLVQDNGVPRLIAIREQFERAPEPKELVVLEGSAHAQFLFQTDQADRLMREILRFLSAP